MGRKRDAAARRASQHLTAIILTLEKMTEDVRKHFSPTAADLFERRATKVLDQITRAGLEYGDLMHQYFDWTEPPSSRPPARTSSSPRAQILTFRPRPRKR